MSEPTAGADPENPYASTEAPPARVVAADIPPPIVRGLGKVVDLLLAGTLILELGSRARDVVPVVTLLHVSEDTLFYVDNIVGPVALWIYLTVAEAIAGADRARARSSVNTGPPRLLEDR